MSIRIPFNKPYIHEAAKADLSAALESGHLCGDGEWSKRCESHLAEMVDVRAALLTHSCTAALEMSALLLDISPGDEVIMPSYTFVSTASAFVLRGAIPVFVDVRSDTFNLDESILEAAITPATKAIVPVHYAGVACEMDTIMSIADGHGISVVEDAAQAVGASYKGRPLGGFGRLGCFSFHETKNVISGEGGALLINDEDLKLRAEIIREKGTNRSQFIRGQVDRYSWVDLGSSFLPSDLIAAFLLPQLQMSGDINRQRLEIWSTYYRMLDDIDTGGRMRLPVLPEDVEHNAHMFALTFEDEGLRDRVQTRLKEGGVQSTSHYVPLHSSVAGKRYGRVSGSMQVTDAVATTLLRLPLWVGMTADMQQHVVEIIATALAES